MILQDVHLHNFRRFESLTMEFHPQLTVVIARNGQGKTTILEAIAAALGPFVGAFDHGVSAHLTNADARYVMLQGAEENVQQFPVEVAASISSPRQISWSRARNSVKGRTTTKEAAPLANWGKELQDALRHDVLVELPVVAYYSSQRLWVARKMTHKKGGIVSARTLGYEDCLALSSSFRQMNNWLGAATAAWIQQRMFRGYRPELLEQRLKGISNAVNAVVQEEGWGDFHYSLTHNAPVLFHPDHGLLPLDMLSDGIRAMVSLVADLAFRCMRLNGHLGAEAPQKSKGIVLIDEIDLHLHPAWQQRVIASLQNAFPEIQFIVSTHSPQVVSTVASESLRVIQHAPDDEQTNRFLVWTPQQQMQGASSALALTEIFGVDPEPETQWSLLRRDLLKSIQSNHHESEDVDALFQKLEQHFGQTHPWITELRSTQRRYALKRRHDVK